MKEFTYTIQDDIGIHARPAGLLAKAAKKYDALCTITKDDRTADLTRLMAVMSLGVKKGETIAVRADGAEEEKAITELKSVFEQNL